MRTTMPKFLKIGAGVGLCSFLLAIGSITIAAAKQSPPIAIASPPAPLLLGEQGKGRSAKKDKKADGRNTAKAKLLAIFLKVFEGHLGAIP